MTRRLIRYIHSRRKTKDCTWSIFSFFSVNEIFKLMYCFHMSRHKSFRMMKYVYTGCLRDEYIFELTTSFLSINLAKIDSLFMCASWHKDRRVGCESIWALVGFCFSASEPENQVFCECYCCYCCVECRARMYVFVAVRDGCWRWWRCCCYIKYSQSIPLLLFLSMPEMLETHEARTHTGAYKRTEKLEVLEFQKR